MVFFGSQQIGVTFDFTTTTDLTGPEVESWMPNVKFTCIEWSLPTVIDGLNGTSKSCGAFLMYKRCDDFDINSPYIL
jgi:hypothetical protein